MTVTVVYRAQFKRAAGLAEESFAFRDGMTVADVIGLVAEKHGESLRPMLVDEAGNSRASVIVLVNDKVASRTDVIATGDVVTLLSPMAGG